MFLGFLTLIHAAAVGLLAGWKGRLGGARWRALGAAAGLVTVVVLGVAAVRVQAFMPRRMGDLDVFLRAAWAVRAGNDLYRATDDNGWHYHYPPLLAILLVPLADPPAGATATWAVPYPVAAGLWYLGSVACLGSAVHRLARAVERRAGGGEWWALRLLPVLACLPPVVQTFLRGQVNLLLLLLVCGWITDSLRGRSWRAGLWLAGAVCLKVVPLFLLLYPAWRRDLRCLAGCGLGLVVGLGVVPAAVLGPARAWDYAGEWAEVLLLPTLADGADTSRARELTDTTATDHQSFQALFHAALHPDRLTRPARASAGVRAAHWLVGVALTALTLAAAGLRRARSPATEALFPGALLVLMVLASPVSHRHYFCLSIPVVLALLARTERPRWGLKLLLIAHLILTALPLLPEGTTARDWGAGPIAALALWLAAVRALWSGHDSRCANSSAVMR